MKKKKCIVLHCQKKITRRRWKKMSKSGYSRSGLFGTINHYDSHGHDTASYARVYQAVVTADKRWQSQRVEHDMRAKQTKVCDAERAGFHTPIFILCTQPYGFACQPLRGLVTSRQRRVITHASNYLQTDGQLIVQGRTACSIPSLTASLAAVFSARDNSICTFHMAPGLCSSVPRY